MRGVGGSVLGDTTLGVSSEWVRVAILEVESVSAGDPNVVSRSAGPMIGISVVDRVGNLEAASVEFGRSAFRIGDARDGRIGRR